MNLLSVILYFADIAANVMGVISGIGYVLISGFVVFNMYKVISVINHNIEHEYHHCDESSRKHGFVCKPWLIIGLVMIIISNFIPTKQTMYMIAASEIGETIVLSPEMTETMVKVKTVVDLKLDDVISELSNGEVEPVVENK